MNVKYQKEFIMTRTRNTSRADMELFASKNKGLLVLIGLTLVGVLIGSALIGGMSSETVELLSFMTDGFIKSRVEQSILSTLSSSLFTSALFLMITMLFGFSAISQPLIVFMPLFRGLGLGFSMGYLYSFYGLKGILICLVLILPNALLSSLTLVIGCREAMRLSAMFLKFAMGNPEQEAVRGAIRLYLGKFSILFAIAAVSSVIDAVLTFLFARMLIK